MIRVLITYTINTGVLTRCVDAPAEIGSTFADVWVLCFLGSLCAIGALVAVGTLSPSLPAQTRLTPFVRF